jgi:hypothetical protein
LLASTARSSLASEALASSAGGVRARERVRFVGLGAVA